MADAGIRAAKSHDGRIVIGIAINKRGKECDATFETEIGGEAAQILVLDLIEALSVERFAELIKRITDVHVRRIGEGSA